jgi:hypothetical protein
MPGNRDRSSASLGGTKLLQSPSVALERVDELSSAGYCAMICNESWATVPVPSLKGSQTVGVANCARRAATVIKSRTSPRGKVWQICIRVASRTDARFDRRRIRVASEFPPVLMQQYGSSPKVSSRKLPSLVPGVDAERCGS